MKNRKFISLLTFTSALILGITSCGGGGGGDPTPTAKFTFDLSLSSGRNNVLYVGVEDSIQITEHNADASKTYSYTVTASGVDNVTDYVTYSLSDKLISLNPLRTTGKDSSGNDVYITITVKEASVKSSKSLSFTIANQSEPANAGYNFASSSTAAAKQERTEILGKLEEYAMENYLTGITLFENGGYVRYSKRVNIPATEYITGYGWGILSEGSLTGTLPNATDHADYLQSASSSDPLTINAWDATGSQVSDLNSYISSSYWGTRMKGTKAYEWYPVLAKDKVGGEDFLRPIPQEEPNALNMYKKWRVYVKTGAEEGIAYRTASSARASYNNRLVALEDYEFVYQMLLSERSQVVRGSELAGDTSYGIKGGQAFYRKSKNMLDEDFDSKGLSKLDRLWNQMKNDGDLGIATGTDSNGSYIDIELVNPIDAFTAMYTLSSNLYTPMPKQFLREIGGGDYTVGALLYGTFPDVGSDVRDMTLCIGPYYLDSWDQNQQVIFSRNDDWFEVKHREIYGQRYLIPGVRIRTIPAIAEDDNQLWLHFENGEVDSTNFPKDHMGEIGDGNGQDRKSEGSSTFKLNVNSCDQDTWNSLFGTKGSVNPDRDDAYLCKPWMSNKNFLKGLFWSINCKQFADNRGVNPSINYFSSSYLSDPENGVSYNSTIEHINAVKNFHNVVNGVDDYGYDKPTAVNAFRTAVNELTSAGKLEYGTAANPTIITIHIRWMYETDINSYGQEIKNYFEDAFNDSGVCGGRIKLQVEQAAVKQWDQVYNDYLMTGKFDLGFGAISGNTYNPLNFLEVLKSNNSSGFTLNWGTDTGIVDPVNPITYLGKTWSFDALWAAADHGTVVKSGKDVKPVENCYLKSVSNNNLFEGATFEVPFSFVQVDKVRFKVERIQLFLLGYGSLTIYKKGDSRAVGIYYEETSEGYKITISADKGAEINQAIVDANDLQTKADKPGVDDETKWNLLHPFRYDTYNGWWDFEVYYSMAILNDQGEAGYPSENVAYAYINKSAQDSDR